MKTKNTNPFDFIKFSNQSYRKQGGEQVGGKPDPNESEVSEVVFSDAENLSLVASLCSCQSQSRHPRLDWGSSSSPSCLFRLSSST